MKHNNVIPNVHLRKHWSNRVRCYFNQAAQKKIRYQKRQAKATRLYPRPTEALRPICRGQSVRFNKQLKLGRGFSLQELKAAKITVQYAQSIGIAVDHRRINKCQETVELNAKRLQAYLSKLVVYKLHGKDEVNDKVQVSQVKSTEVIPVQQPAKREKAVKITKAMKEKSVYRTQRQERTNKKWNGKRVKRAQEAEKKD